MQVAVVEEWDNLKIAKVSQLAGRFAELNPSKRFRSFEGRSGNSENEPRISRMNTDKGRLLFDAVCMITKVRQRSPQE